MFSYLDYVDYAVVSVVVDRFDRIWVVEVVDGIHDFYFVDVDVVALFAMNAIIEVDDVRYEIFFQLCFLYRR